VASVKSSNKSGSGLLNGKKDVKVKITKRTVSFDGQIYQLQNLARVQNWKLVPNRKKLAYRALRLILPWLIVLTAVNVLLAASGGNMPSGLRTFDLIALLVLALIGFGKFAKDGFRRPQWVLLLETSGYPIGVIASNDHDKIQDVVNEIAEAIENPPTSPRYLHVGDVVLGDQINQSGDSPVGKVLFGA